MFSKKSYHACPLHPIDEEEERRSAVSARESKYFSAVEPRIREWLRHRNPRTRTGVVNAICECKHVFLFFL